MHRNKGQPLASRPSRHRDCLRHLRGEKEIPFERSSDPNMPTFLIAYSSLCWQAENNADKMPRMSNEPSTHRAHTALSEKVIGCAIEVHRNLGPGLLEATYQQCLAHELRLNDILFQMEYPLPVSYKGIQLDCGYRLDFLIDNSIILELKSVGQLKPIHEAQLLTYLKLSGVKRGYLINFNVTRLVDGLRTLVV